MRPLIRSSLIAAAAMSLLAAGCGGGSARTAATTTAATTNPSGALAFARCMRSHGFPGWPDPDRSGVFDKAKLRQLGYSASRVRAIGQSACGRLLPIHGPSGQQVDRTRLADALSFARCMRSRGLISFPDPNPQGELSVEMVQAQGIDVHSPAVLRNVQACLPASHGWLTMAKVRAALSQPGG
jgi:hypothetical protein